MAVSTDGNVVQNGVEMNIKYKSLCTEIQRMLNMICIIPVIIEANGIETNGVTKNLEVIPEKHSIYSLKKTAILGTLHTIRKVSRSGI